MDVWMYGCGLDVDTGHTPENLTEYYSTPMKTTMKWIM